MNAPIAGPVPAHKPPPPGDPRSRSSSRTRSHVASPANASPVSDVVMSVVNNSLCIICCVILNFMRRGVKDIVCFCMRVFLSDVCDNVW